MQKFYITALIFVFISATSMAQTIWSGPDTTFTKPDNADYTLAANQDSLTSNVILTRANSGSIFNIAQESSAANNSPVDTEWAIGSTDSLSSLSFSTFRSLTSGNSGNTQLNNDMVVHLISDDIYIDVDFTSWSSGQSGGGFAYTRSTPGPTSMNENQKTELKVFPNPAQDFMKISGVENSAQVVIHDLSGRAMKTLQAYKGGKIQVQDLSSGLYFIIIEQEKMIKLMKY